MRRLKLVDHAQVGSVRIGNDVRENISKETGRINRIRIRGIFRASYE